MVTNSPDHISSEQGDHSAQILIKKSLPYAEIISGILIAIFELFLRLFLRFIGNHPTFVAPFVILLVICVVFIYAIHKAPIDRRVIWGRAWITITLLLLPFAINDELALFTSSTIAWLLSYTLIVFPLIFLTWRRFQPPTYRKMWLTHGFLLVSCVSVSAFILFKWKDPAFTAMQAFMCAGGYGLLILPLLLRLISASEAKYIRAVDFGCWVLCGVCALIFILFLPRELAPECSQPFGEISILHRPRLSLKALSLSIAKGYLHHLGTSLPSACRTNEDTFFVYDPVIKERTMKIEKQRHWNGGSDKELDRACELRMMPVKDIETPVGFSRHDLGIGAISIIANKGQPSRLSLEEIRDIFTGNISEWSKLNSQVTGHINIYAPPKGEDDFKIFKQIVLGDSAPSNDIRHFTSSRSIYESVAADQHGIGLIDYEELCRLDMSAVNLVAVLDHNNPQSTFTIPTPNTMKNGEYPLCYRLVLDVPENEGDFDRFVRSEEMRKIVSEFNYVPETEINVPTAEEERKQCEKLIYDDRYLDFPIRFEHNKISIVGNAYDQIQLFKSQLASGIYSGHTILLLGFADEVGSATINQEFSERRALMAKEALKDTSGDDLDRQYNIRIETKGLGSSCPIDSGSTEAAHAKNRRVEIWVRK